LQDIQRLPVGRQAAAGHDAVHMRVVRHRRAPRVQHERGADRRAQVLRIGGDGEQRLGGDLEQQADRPRPCWCRRRSLIGAGSVKTTW
jgi:hypothetical protein